MNEDLKRERIRTSFDTKELSAILYGGTETHSAIKRLGMYYVQSAIFKGYFEVLQMFTIWICLVNGYIVIMFFINSLGVVNNKYTPPPHLALAPPLPCSKVIIDISKLEMNPLYFTRIRS